MLGKCVCLQNHVCGSVFTTHDNVMVKTKVIKYGTSFQQSEYKTKIVKYSQQFQKDYKKKKWNGNRF